MEIVQILLSKLTVVRGIFCLVPESFDEKRGGLRSKVSVGYHVPIPQVMGIGHP